MQEVKTDIKKLVEKGLDRAISYDDYRTMVSDLVEKGLSTGPEQTEALLNYSTLNDRRMKRLGKTVKLSPEIENVATDFAGDITWLVLTESWCGDAAQTMPVMDKIAKLNDGIDFKVILRDENLELMDEFLTNGNRSIPKLIAVDNATGEITNTWGPRPSTATKMVQDYKEAHGALTPEFKQNLQVWYNKDKGQDTAKDLAALLR